MLGSVIRRGKCGLFTGLIGFLCLPGCKGELVTWSLQLKPGDTRTVIETLNETLQNGDAPASPMKSEFTAKLSVLEFDPVQGATIEVTFRDLKRDSSMLGFEVRDRAIRGKKYTVLLSPDGKVQSVKGLDVIRQAVEAEFKKTDEIPEERRDGLLALNLGGLTDGSIKKDFETAALIPPKPTNIGGSWSTNGVEDQDGSTITDTTWTIEKVENGDATVSFEATIRSATSNPEHQVKGTDSGTVVVSTATGLVKKRESTKEMETVYGGDRRMRTTVDQVTEVYEIE